MRSAVIVFPGSNCERDMSEAIRKISGKQPKYIWHQETELPQDIDLLAIPGGFSYGDFLRSGSMAARTSIMPAIIEAAEKGVNIIGACNGFQILTEAGLLPGALIRNQSTNYICRTVPLRVETINSPFSRTYKEKQTILIPVAHHDGNYFATDDEIDALEQNEQIIFRYINNVNGSKNDIAGITNKRGNILGMMPHPERAIDDIHGSTDGRQLFEGLLQQFA